MRLRSNRVRGAYALTVFTPIVPGREEALRSYIEALPVGAQSPLARLRALHLARIQIFDELVDQGDGHRVDRLRFRQLLFTSTFDGALDAYLDEICSLLGAEADGWWGHCVGYPGTTDRAAFQAWIRAHQVDTNLFASAFPAATVQEMLEGLALREQVAAFAADAQGLDAATLQSRFLATFGGAR
jgi:hypothetical protein